MRTLLALAATMLALAGQANAGVVYSARMEKFGKKSTFAVWATDSKAKFSVTASDDPKMPTGTSIIALDGGQRYILIDPERRAFIGLTRDQYSSLREKQAESHGIQILNPKLEELVVNGDGGVVAGNKTRYFKLSISLNAAEDGRQVAIVATEEFWTAPSLPDPAPSLDMLTQQVSGLAKLDELLDYKKLHGYPLKRVVQLQENGQFAGSSLVEVTRIAQSRIPDSTFDLPAGYAKLDISGRLQ